jgi:hypothetical protein|tara:strand:+ start:530 stop:1609 length:1080 start_codon:yes stop_codon:yes gene_type:complete
VSQKPLENDILQDALEIDAKIKKGIYLNITRASQDTGIPRSTLKNRIDRAREKEATGELASTGDVEVQLPVFPDDDISVDEILDTMELRFRKRAAAASARKWWTCKLNTSKPVGLCFIGDVHIDSNGCNIPLLRRDCSLMSQRDDQGKPLFFCINLGDSSDGDWPGRLMRLHAQSDQSRSTAHRLVDWFLNSTNLTYLAILIGNHDAWGEGAEILNRMNVQKIPMLDWVARFTVKFKNDRECKIIASHSFPGRSWINPLHSNQRQEMQEEANIYASGHTHDWGIHQSENSMRDSCYWLLRARGYKFLDLHADRLGHQPQQFAATVCAIVDPQATTEANFIQCFADLEEASEYLKWKRSR